MVVHRRDEGLDDEYVPLAAVLLELDLKTAVAEPVDRSRTQRHAQIRADALGEIWMRAAGEDDDLSHR